MAEFCLDCWNRLNGTRYTEAEMEIDRDELDICEGCGKLCFCIIGERGPVGRFLWRLRHRPENPKE